MTGRFYALDFALLPPPDVVEPLDFEVLYARVRDEFTDAWTRSRTIDPTLPEVGTLLIESHPVAMVLEAFAYSELLLRERVNTAARSVMIQFAEGTDLDNLAGMFGVTRLEDESDSRLRERVSAAPDALSAAGTQGAYVYHAMTAAPAARKVTAVHAAPGRVHVTVQGPGEDKQPTQDDLVAVRNLLTADDIKPLTDVVAVAGPTVIDAEVTATVTVQEGPGVTHLATLIRQSVDAYVERTTVLGSSLSRSGITAAMHLDGALTVNLVSPAADVVVTGEECVRVTAINIDVVVA